MAEPIKRVPPPPVRNIPPRPNIGQVPPPPRPVTPVEPEKKEVQQDTVQVKEVEVKKEVIKGKNKKELTTEGRFGLLVGISVASFIFAVASIALFFIL